MTQNESYIPAAEAYRRLVGYASPYKFGFFIAVIGMVIIAATEAGFAALMKPMLDGSFVEKDPIVIRYIPFALMGIFLIRGIGSFLANYCMVWIGRNVIRDLREAIFGHLLCLPSGFYDNSSKGTLTSKLIFDVEQVATAVTTAVTIIIRDSLTVLGLFAWMLYLNWQLSLFFITIVPIMAIIIASISSRFRRVSRRIQASMGSVSQATQQIVESDRIIKVFGAQQQESQKFQLANNFNRAQNMKMAVISAVSVPISQFFGAFALAGMLYFATQDSRIETITVGTFMSFVAASMLLMSPFKRLTQVTQSLQQGVAASQSIFQLIDRKAEIDQGHIDVETVRGEFDFQNLSFQYTTETNYVLHDINLQIKSGQTIAIVGKSGSGKTTLASLIPRFYDCKEGDILLDGKSLKEYKLQNLRKHIAMVNQDVALINDSVANNIAYGCSGELDENRIKQAAISAHAWDFIQQLPNGLQTEIGDRGVLLSGGQRQRLAIARAIMKNAPILILDEATSALDSESERAIQEALDKLMQNRTTFVIAHRLSTIQNADVIVVMDEGKIVESGKHQELLQKNGHYAALHNLHFQKSS